MLLVEGLPIHLILEQIVKKVAILLEGEVLIVAVGLLRQGQEVIRKVTKPALGLGFARIIR
jgi:hypothetical protein